VRGGDLCQRCHLDPRARVLPVEVADGPWVFRCVRTLALVLRHPNSTARRVLDPIRHGPVLGFLGTLVLPLWLLVLAIQGWSWATADLAVPEIRAPSSASHVLGAPVAKALSLYFLLLVPLLLLALYLIAGNLGHMALALTGGARRSIGATMRATGYALAPLVLVAAALECLLRIFALNPDIWGLALALAGIFSLVRLGLALARTHDTSIIRGILCALVPLVFVLSMVTCRAALELPRLPFSAAVELSPYAPFVIPP